MRTVICVQLCDCVSANTNADVILDITTKQQNRASAALITSETMRYIHYYSDTNTNTSTHNISLSSQLSVCIHCLLGDCAFAMSSYANV
jgi:hypothetical protein